MDIEKVIKGLDLCQQGFDCPAECPYLDDCNDPAKPMFVDLARDALALLRDGLQLLPDVMQELVRCKDCKYLDSDWDYCPMLDKDDVEPEWFCADGERKEGR